MSTGALGLRPASRVRVLDRLWWPAVVLAASAVTAGLTLWSVEAALAAACVAVLLAVYVTDRTAGIGATLAFWWIVPGLRRVVQWKLGYVSADPLSLAPFLATGGIVAFELARSRLSPRATRILCAAALAFAIGLPVGLAHGAFAATYAFFGYLSGLGFLVVGYREAISGRTSGLWSALRWVLPLVAIYALVQSFATMPPWDRSWLDTVDITSIGVGPGTDAVRAFATLNSPGTFAGVLAVGLAWYLAVRRPGGWGAISVALLLAALALTYVRGAWIGLIVAAIAHAVVTRGASLPRLAGAALATVVVVGVMAGSNPAAGSLVTRISTLGALNQDTSAQARVARPQELLGTAVRAPVGHGLGTVGEASRLGGSSSTELRYSDNAYLALILQSGPVALLIMLGALAAVVRSAWRLARHAPAAMRAQAESCFAVIVLVVVFMVSGDHFYGAVGVLFWLVAGYVLGLEKHLQTVHEHSEGTSS